MGANKTYQQKGDRGRMLGESDEFKRLRHAVEKAAGDRERAIRNVCPPVHREPIRRAARRDPDGHTGAARRGRTHYLTTGRPASGRVS
jgi:hypothetical protein